MLEPNLPAAMLVMFAAVLVFDGFVGALMILDYLIKEVF